MGKKRPQLRKKLPETKKAKTSEASEDIPSKPQRQSKDGDDEDNRDSSENDEEDDEDDDESDGEINLDKQVELTTEEYTFEFNDMKDVYYLGLRTILNTFISQLNMSSEITEQICKQGTVGTVVNNEGDGDVFAFATILPYTSIQDLSFCKELVKGVTNAKHTTPHSQALLALLQQPSQASQLGFLFHGRFTNLPIELIYELHRNLWEDISWAQKYKKSDKKKNSNDSKGSSNSNASDSNDDEVDEEEVRQFQQMGSFLCVANVSLTGNTKPGTVTAGQSVLGWNDLLFHNFEDEFYFQQAELAVVGTKHDFYKACSGPDAAGTLPIVLQVPLAKLQDIVTAMKDLMP